MIRELIVKDREREEEDYLFDEKGKKNEVLKIQENFTTSWKDNIYQKAEKNRFLFLVWQRWPNGNYDDRRKKMKTHV